MGKVLNIIIATVMWCAIVAYLVASGMYARDRREGITVQQVRISTLSTTRSTTRNTALGTTRDTAPNKLIAPETVTRWLKEGGFDPEKLIGRPADSLDLRAIERHIASRPEVSHVGVWTDLDSTLTVEVRPRTPFMRIRTSGGYRFWMTDDGYILRDRGNTPSYVPVITGSIPFPFSPSWQGSYDELLKSNYNDFLGQFSAIESERQRLSSGLSSTRAELRTVRAQNPKRLWSKARKKSFLDAKPARIADLEAKIRHIELSLSDLMSKKRALSEKEKKSLQSHLFLTKLANFVRFIEGDDFWSAAIVQIDVSVRGATGTETETASTGTSATTGTSTARWKEPELELVPRAGEHIVLLGTLDGEEQQRLEKLRLFYSKGMWHEGWSKYKRIDIRYKDQVVCTE